MSNVNDGFQEVVNKMNPMWDCCNKKVKAEDGSIVSMPRAKGDDSFITGYYLGMETKSGKSGKDFTIHNLKLKAVGNPEHLSEAVEVGGDVSVWGKTTLDEMLLKNVPIGTLCKIVWEGQIPSKANPGQKYHVFKVFVNANETLSASDVPVNNVVTHAPQQMATSDVLDADDDSMPF
jgi:hypothetical protein